MGAEKGRPYSCPWWVDKMVYGLAFMQGKGVYLSSLKEPKSMTLKPKH